MLDYNYLTSPNKLMEYQKCYFDNHLIENKIQNLNWINIKKNEIEINKIANIDE